MAYIQKSDSEKVVRRGEMWIVAPNPIQKGVVDFTRTAIVVSNDAGNVRNSEIVVVYTTTALDKQNHSINVLLTTPRRPSVACCNQIERAPIAWFSRKLCTLSASEMEQIDDALCEALYLGRRKDYEIRIQALEEKLHFAELKYEELLRKIAREQMERDITRLTTPVKPEPPKAEDVKKRVDLNKATYEELFQLGIPHPVCKTILDKRPFEKLDDVPGNTGMTKMQWALIKVLVYLSHDAPVSEGKKPELINVNTATAKQLTSIKGIGQKVADRIVEARKTAQLKTLDEIAAINQIGPAAIKALDGRICFD